MADILGHLFLAAIHWLIPSEWIVLCWGMSFTHSTGWRPWNGYRALSSGTSLTQNRMQGCGMVVQMDEVRWSQRKEWHCYLLGGSGMQGEKYQNKSALMLSQLRGATARRRHQALACPSWGLPITIPWLPRLTYNCTQNTIIISALKHWWSQCCYIPYTCFHRKTVKIICLQWQHIIAKWRGSTLKHGLSG